MSPEAIKKARQMIQAGATWKAVGRELGCAADTVRRWLDPQWAEMRRKQVNEARLRKRLGNPVQREKPQSLRVAVKADAERAFAQVPPDTRDLTARIFGDPLPGRSALDQREAA